MRKLIILCLALASTAAAETTTIEIALDAPYTFREELIAVPLEAGRHFTGIQSVSIRVIGTVGSHANWTCYGWSPPAVYLAGASVAAGFTEGRDAGMLQPFIIPGSDSNGGEGYLPREDLELDHSFVFDVHPREGHAWDWGFLGDGQAELVIGPVDPHPDLSYWPYNPLLEYDPCPAGGDFWGLYFWGLYFGVTRVEVTIESDTVVRSASSSFGAVKSLFSSGSGQRDR